MLRKRNLVALVMAVVLSLGTIGVALADDSGADRIGGSTSSPTSIDLIVAN